jgi:hypothetical protein
MYSFLGIIVLFFVMKKQKKWKFSSIALRIVRFADVNLKGEQRKMRGAGWAPIPVAHSR